MQTRIVTTAPAPFELYVARIRNRPPKKMTIGQATVRAVSGQQGLSGADTPFLSVAPGERVSASTVVLQDWKIAAFCLLVSVLSVGLVAFWRAKAAEAEPG
jgi:hypothetical protein